MPTELRVQAVHAGGMKVKVRCGEHEVLTDYPLQPGAAAAGYRPMELLLASLAACGGSVVALLLGRMGQPITGLEVDVRGQRRDEHPTVFTHIAVEFKLHGAGIDPARVAEAITQADERLCPVWAMLKPGVPIQTSYTIDGA
jgi:putative redox protein